MLKVYFGLFIFQNHKTDRCFCLQCLTLINVFFLWQLKIFAFETGGADFCPVGSSSCDLYGIRHFCYWAKATKQTDGPCAFPWILGMEEERRGVHSKHMHENMCIWRFCYWWPVTSDRPLAWLCDEYWKHLESVFFSTLWLSALGEMNTTGWLACCMCTRALLETVGMLSAAPMTILLLFLQTVRALAERHRSMTIHWHSIWIQVFSKQLNALVTDHNEY